jgi:hypothetical protein
MALPTSAVDRQAMRDEIRAKFLARAEKRALEASRSMKCGEDWMPGGRRHATDPDGCKNDGLTCLCECHDPSLSPLPQEGGTDD